MGVFNVFSYLSVRAGGAALTAFLFCLIIGPTVIHWLRMLKIGQVIKKDHVADLHELHKGKAGTPTMGGVIMILATVLAMILWSTLTSRVVGCALFAFVMLGCVGFLDDYIKLKRKHNDGLSARAKFAGQILVGAVLGLYLYFNPITVSATYVQYRDVQDWDGFARTLYEAGQDENASVGKKVWATLDAPVQKSVTAAVRNGGLSSLDKQALVEALEDVVWDRQLYDESLWKEGTLTTETKSLLGKAHDSLRALQVVRLNRLLLEAAFPSYIAVSGPNQHTKVEIPGLKNVWVPLGVFYIALVIFMIVAISNAVNLTDGLDGLAAGTSIVSILAYTGIAYVVSRADWSQYLYVTHVPEASELFVFGGALLGAGMGFLWYNSYPAEVFMGDTGSLALGGAIGSMAILTKHELLLPLVAGLFVLEAASVVIQVGSFKLTGKRVFRMAPLHHHFELGGWGETKVVMRFWIIALIFALMSLGTLKLR